MCLVSGVVLFFRSGGKPRNGRDRGQGTGARRKHNLPKLRLVDGERGGDGGGGGPREHTVRAYHVGEGKNQRGYATD